MALSRRQKVFLGVFALAFAAMIADRLFVLPKSAGAGEAPKVTDGDLVVSMPDLPEPCGASPSLAKRLGSLSIDAGAPGDEGRDAFALSASWYAVLSPPPPTPTPAPAPPPPPPDPAAVFEKQHHLAAVVLDGQTSRAVVDECTMKVGQQLDGFTLVSIEADRVVFTSGQRRCELRLAMAPDP
jgi:hypothetical protein